MHKENESHTVDRRLFLGGSALALLAVSNAANAQQPKSEMSKLQAAKPSQIIAEFVANFDLGQAPPIAVERARIAFIDTLGVMLAGSREPASDMVCEMIKLEGSTPAASIVGQSLRTSPQSAALANGVAGHAMDYDFTYFAGQAIAAVIPAILPLAETTGATPAEALAAFIIGAEVAGRISRASPTQSRTGGWHSTGVVGTLAAAAACARLLKTKPAAIPDVIGIATSLASGNSSNFGTMTKPLHAGHAARDGMMATQLGGRGFTANASALEGRDGYFETFSRGLKWSVEPFQDLGRSYDLATYGYKLKRYASGGLGHTGIDAALELRELVRLADVDRVEVAFTKYAQRRITDRYPATVENAKFSASYLAAFTLVHGVPTLKAFTEEALHDEQVRAVARKVSLATYQEHADLLAESPAKVTVFLKDGQKIERAKYYASGSVQVPMTPAQIEAKFFDCASHAISPDAARKLHGWFGRIDQQQSFDEVWPLLRRG
jgi:2-methylcitrate dehydratase PrpD